MASRRRDLGELSPRLLQLSTKTIAVEPYPVTDKLVIRQTRTRRDELHESYTAIETGRRRLQELQRKAAELPEPEQPKADAGEAAEAEYVAALGVWRAQVDHMNEVAETIVEKMNVDANRYERAFFGDAYDEIMELSADWDADFFDAFKADVNEHFLQGVNPPPDGRDDSGAIVDAAEAVEAGKSPT
jgi:hypothetical protein